MRWGEVLELRFEMARQYLRMISGEPFNWDELVQSYRSGALDLPTTMCLVHPRWIRAGAQEAVQGLPRYMPYRGGRPGICQAELLWGHRCEVPASSGMHADHVFPYWAGGPTSAGNRLTLCGLHNLLKAGDVHLFPWERGVPAWVDGAIGRVGAHRPL